MEVRTIKCDQCGKQKQENETHWFQMAQQLTDLKRIHFKLAPLGVRPWVSQTNEQIIHLCGEACAQKQIAIFLKACA